MESVISLEQQLEKAKAPIAQAQGLPNSLYADPASILRERETLFAQGWTGIGFEKDVAEDGDIMPVDFLGNPLVMVRDRLGRLRVFQNACRHRGAILVDRPRNSTGLIRCPYHAWCYRLSGELMQTPHAGGPGIHEHPSLQKSSLGLVEIPSHVFLGVVFVNMSGTAQPFAEHFAGLLDRWSEFARPVHSGGEDSAFGLDLAANWKLAVENYCESYHLPFVHPGLNAYSRLEDHESILGNGPWSGQLTRVYAPPLAPDGRGFECFPGLSGRWDTQAEYLALYPNVLLGVHRDHTFAILLQPLSHDRTREHVAIAYASPQMAGPAVKQLRARNAQLWKDVFTEDIAVVESMQRGRGAMLFDGGRFSPEMDTATHHFHRWVAESVLKNSAPGAKWAHD